ncbi:interferon-induced protein with tetratricopeptide repeats 2-like [Suncus etruscus]|uniref:interferon-induced protein with tetratricopeptide repeats 2-like n=1 Tax=Suncus etruscus TaxID=109475 RepID=UPI002110A7F6|nr:interferon-induced protein with tetratricopeptide repeats 2-like [Suncus etruscus]
MNSEKAVEKDESGHSEVKEIENMKHSLENSLRQLKCHFTWNLMEEDDSLDDIENRFCNENVIQNSVSKTTTYNMLAYIKHCRGQNEAALECLQQAEESIRQEHTDQAEIRSLVTWGNYAWVYYHMDRCPEAQTYVDKVKQVCKKFSSPYSIECPELESEEGWTQLKCGEKQNSRAMVCFQKALEKKPNSPEFTCGLAIAMCRLKDGSPPENSIDSLIQAVQLNPDNQFVKVLMALKLQKMDKENEGKRLVEEVLEKGPCTSDVLDYASKFYRKMWDLDKAIELLKRALGDMPNNTDLHFKVGCIYRIKVLSIFKGENKMYGRNCREAQYLIGQGINHLKKAYRRNKNLCWVSLYLAGLHSMANENEEADYYYQQELSKELTPFAKQKLLIQYGNFQLFQMRNEDKAIHYYMEGVKINHKSNEKEKMKSKLYKIAQKRFYEYREDSLTLQLLEFLQQHNVQVSSQQEPALRMF